MPLTPTEHHQQHNHLTLGGKCWVSEGTMKVRLRATGRGRASSHSGTRPTPPDALFIDNCLISESRTVGMPLSIVLKLVLTWEDLEYSLLQECTGWAVIAYTRGATGISEGPHPPCVCVLAYLSNNGPCHHHTLGYSGPLSPQGTFYRSTLHPGWNEAMVISKTFWWNQVRKGPALATRSPSHWEVLCKHVLVHRTSELNWAT